MLDSAPLEMIEGLSCLMASACSAKDGAESDTTTYLRGNAMAHAVKFSEDQPLEDRVEQSPNPVITEAERAYFLTPAEYERFIAEAYKPADYERTVRAWPAA